MAEAATQDTNTQPVVTPEGEITIRLTHIEERLQDIEGQLHGFEDQLFENRVVAIVKDALKHPFTFPTNAKKKVAKVTVAKPKA